MTLLKCEDVCFAYEGNIALKNISFHVDSGDYLAIVGENGAGKSTLIKGLLRLKKPASGQIFYGDQLKENEIGYLPQQTLIQKDFPASVDEVVLSGCLNHLGNRFFYSHKQKRKAEDKMELLGISHLRSRCYRDLSGGQQQRVLLARALCAAETILLLDEPVTGLDPVVAHEMYKIIRMLHHKQGMTIIMVSHDVAGAVKEADHILHLDGTQKFFGTTAQYKESSVGQFFMKGMSI